jgi:hypothetical protein
MNSGRAIKVRRFSFYSMILSLNRMRGHGIG